MPNADQVGGQEEGQLGEGQDLDSVSKEAKEEDYVMPFVDLVEDYYKPVNPFLLVIE